MAADPPPADFEVTRTSPAGTQSIYACRGHLAHTRALLERQGGTVTAGPANRDGDGNQLDTPVHGCKGHLEDWPVS